MSRPDAWNDGRRVTMANLLADFSVEQLVGLLEGKQHLVVHKPKVQASDTDPVAEDFAGGYAYAEREAPLLLGAGGYAATTGSVVVPYAQERALIPYVLPMPEWVVRRGIAADQADDGVRYFPACADVATGKPTARCLPAGEVLADTDSPYTAIVESCPLRISAQQNFQLFDMAHDNNKARLFLHAIFSELNFHTEQQAAYIRYMRNRIAHGLVYAPDRWLAFARQAEVDFAEELPLVFDLLLVMQHSTHEDVFKAALYTEVDGHAIVDWLHGLASRHWKDKSHARYLAVILHMLCLANDEARLKQWLALPDVALIAAINRPQEHGAYLLHSAIAFMQDDECVRSIMMLSDDLTVRASRYANATPLLMAVVYNRMAVVGMLLRYATVQATINYTDDYGNTALHWAIKHGNLRMVEMLLNACLLRGDAIDASIVNKQGETILHCAALQADPAILDLLLKHVDCAAALNVADNEGNTVQTLRPELPALLHGGAEEVADEWLMVPVALPIDDFPQPAEYVRDAVHKVLQILESQLAGDLRFTRDVVKVRRELCCTMERIACAKNYLTIHRELRLLQGKRAGSRSYLRSTSVELLQRIGFLQHVPVTGVAYALQLAHYRTWPTPPRDPVIARHRLFVPQQGQACAPPEPTAPEPSAPAWPATPSGKVGGQ